MNANRTSEVMGPTVIAIAQEESKLRAVCLRKQDGLLRVLWTKSSESGQTDLGAFAVECGLPVSQGGETEAGGDQMVVVGFNSAGVVFYRMLVPAVKAEEIAAMVKLQVEARLPLPAEQIELAWRAGPVRSEWDPILQKNRKMGAQPPSRTGLPSVQTSNGAGRVRDGQVAVTIAAARKEQISEFVEDVRGFEPAKILLDCEGIVKAWREVFSGSAREAVVVSIGSRNTQVCLVEFGRLSNAVVLDTGMEDFSAEQGLERRAETAERFAQDVRSVLELFGYAEPGELPVFMLSDGGSVIERIASCLESAGLNVRVAVPEVQKLRETRDDGRGMSAEDIYEYRVPIGLALMGFVADGEELNIFERLYNPAAEKEKKRWLYSPKVAGVIAAVMLAVLVIVSYAVDVASPNAIEKRLKAAACDTDINLLMERQKLIETIARGRPDLLGLLNEINVNDAGGIMLDSFDFKKGRLVNISGQAQSAEQLYRFQKTLLVKKGITEVKIKNAAPAKASGSSSARKQGDAKGGNIKFTVTFHYKNFTK